MLKMSGGFTVTGNGSPAVFKHVNFTAAEVDHGLNGEAHPWFEEGTAATTSEIRDLW